MGVTKIEWTHRYLLDGRILKGFSFNGWLGCTKVSPACDSCYAAVMNTRWGRVVWGPGGTRVRTGDANWAAPLMWNRQAAAAGVRPLVFAFSLSDVFEQREDLAGWRYDFFELVKATPNLEWLILTKRTRSMARFFKRHPQYCLNNIRAGTSVENPDVAPARLAALLSIDLPNFVSAEPFLGAINFRPWLSGIDWLVAGGESGTKPRPSHPAWLRVARDDCDEFGVPFHFKQWGSYVPVEKVQTIVRPKGNPMYALTLHDGRERSSRKLPYRFSDGQMMLRLKKEEAGREFDGRVWNGSPYNV